MQLTFPPSFLRYDHDQVSSLPAEQETREQLLSTALRRHCQQQRRGSSLYMIEDVSEESFLWSEPQGESSEHLLPQRLVDKNMACSMSQQYSTVVKTESRQSAEVSSSALLHAYSLHASTH